MPALTKRRFKLWSMAAIELVWKRLWYHRYNVRAQNVVEQTIDIADRFLEYIGHGHRWTDLPFLRSVIQFISSTNAVSTVNYAILSSNDTFVRASGTAFQFPRSSIYTPIVNRFLMSSEMGGVRIAIYEHVFYSEGSGALAGNRYIQFSRGGMYIPNTVAQLKERISQLKYTSYILEDKD